MKLCMIMLDTRMVPITPNANRRASARDVAVEGGPPIVDTSLVPKLRDRLSDRGPPPGVTERLTSAAKIAPAAEGLESSGGEKYSMTRPRRNG